MKHILSVTLFLLLAGCYSGYSMTKTPPVSDQVNRNYNRSGQVPVYISSISVKNNSMSAGFENRLIAKMNETGLYGDVIYGIYARRPTTEFIDASLSITEVVEDHTASNATKGFFVGATLFLLTPALPLKYDIEDHFALHVVWPNGQQRDYTANCAAHAYGTLYQLQPAANTASGESVDRCLTSVVNQMGADAIHMIGRPS